MDRRVFIRSAMASAVSGWLFGKNFLAAMEHPPARSMVIKTRLQRSSETSDFSLQQILAVLDRALERLCHLSGEAAWRRFFKADDTVGLKVNALAGKGLSTNKILVQGICHRLQDLGIAAERIIIFDRMDRDLQRAGYTINRGKNLPQCYGNDQAGFDDYIYEYGLVGSRVSRLVTDTCTVVINLPVLKDHGIVGVSGALKNLFGLIDNPNKYHDHAGDPYVADVAMLKPIRDKVRLTICDALTAQFEGGPPYMPQWSWQMNTLMVATDMVAMDRIIWEIIEEKRRQQKLPTLKQAGREPSYIATAADSEHRLGYTDLNRIDVIEL